MTARADQPSEAELRKLAASLYRADPFPIFTTACRCGAVAEVTALDILWSQGWAKRLHPEEAGWWCPECAEKELRS